MTQIPDLIKKMDSAAIYYEGDDCAGSNLWRELKSALSTLPIAGEGKVKALDEPEGPFHVSRTFDGENHWFSARDAASGVSIPGKSRDDARALVASLNRAIDLHLRLASSSSPGKDGGQEVEERDKPMSLVVALDFADNPRPYHTLQAPADTNGELYEALRVIAEAYRAQPASTALVERGNLACPCTTFQQDDDCEVGYPSLLCTACDGKGITTVDKVVALAAEMMKVAEQVDELEDPFAAWETIDLLKSQNERLTKALEPFAKRAARWDDIPGIYRCHDNVELWQNGNWRCDLTVGDLREARSAIAAANGESTDANS